MVERGLLEGICFLVKDKEDMVWIRIRVGVKILFFILKVGFNRIGYWIGCGCERKSGD